MADGAPANGYATIEPPTESTGEEQESWNNPRRNLFRILAVFWSFIVIGLNGGCYGVLLPCIQEYYTLSYTTISLIFFPNLCGVLAASMSNKAIHHAYGQRGIAILGPGCQFVAWSIIASHPPFPIIIVCIALASFGTSLQDGGWNAWIGNMKNATQTLGILHGIFGIGAVLAPSISTLMIHKAGLAWYTYYYLLAACAALTFVVSATTFWTADGEAYRASTPQGDGPDTTTTKAKQSSTLYSLISHEQRGPIVRNTALFVIAYVGIETALAGWIVTFMTRIRHAEDVGAGFINTGFWAGLAIGRVCLGFITPRIGERVAIASYLLATLGLEVIFWLVPTFIVSAICVALQGVFLGPMYPAAVFVFTKLLPKSMHITGITIICSCGGVGGFLFPFVVGSLAEKVGLNVLQPMCAFLVLSMLFFWLRLPKPKSGTGEQEPLLNNATLTRETVEE